MFPLFLNLTGRLAVVIGGGPVGRRKASAVLASGGRVRLVCLQPRPAEVNDPRLDWLTEPYTAAQLDGASLVFAAGPEDLNAQVVADARQRGVWVNAASDPDQGDFFLPATIRRGDFVLAIGTGGAAPILTQIIRERLEAEYDETFGVWVELLAELRRLVREHIPEADRRRDLLTKLCQWEWLDRLRREGRDAVRTAMRAEIEKVAGMP
jgi:precorrin-2 dehydrogenase/sirohydrochlorin ferrochelatase